MSFHSLQMKNRSTKNREPRPQGAERQSQEVGFPRGQPGLGVIQGTERSATPPRHLPEHSSARSPLSGPAVSLPSSGSGGARKRFWPGGDREPREEGDRRTAFAAGQNSGLFHKPTSIHSKSPRPVASGNGLWAQGPSTPAGERVSDGGRQGCSFHSKHQLPRQGLNVMGCVFIDALKLGKAK